MKLVDVCYSNIGKTFWFSRIGNPIVITVVIRNSSMHSVTNFFILNLAISDVIMCMVAVPFTPLMSFAGRITEKNCHYHHLFFPRKKIDIFLCFLQRMQLFFPLRNTLNCWLRENFQLQQYHVLSNNGFRPICCHKR